MSDLGVLKWILETNAPTFLKPKVYLRRTKIENQSGNREVVLCQRGYFLICRKNLYLSECKSFAFSGGKNC